MIEEITDKVDKATDHLQVTNNCWIMMMLVVEAAAFSPSATLTRSQGLNAKIKDALEQVGGASRIIVNLILLIIVIAIAAFA